MNKQRSYVIGLGAGAALMAMVAGGILSAAAPTAPYIAPVPPTPPQPPLHGIASGPDRLSAADRAEIRAAAEEARAAAREAADAGHEAMREAEQARHEADAARQEAEVARQEAMAAAVEARREAFADRQAFAERSPVTGGGYRTEVRTALTSARASILSAQGMREADRKAALESLDRAMAGLDRGWSRGPMLQ